MQPRGLGIPAILAAVLAGPLGKSWYSSLTVTPEVLPSTRTVGPVPLAWYSARMNLMTCQCRGVSSSMPSALAICGAMSSVHWPGSVRNPSLLTLTLWLAYVAVGTSDLLGEIIDGRRWRPGRHSARAGGTCRGR